MAAMIATTNQNQKITSVVRVSRHCKPGVMLAGVWDAATCVENSIVLPHNSKIKQACEPTFQFLVYASENRE